MSSPEQVALRPDDIAAALALRLGSWAAGPGRRLVGIAGGPGAGKSTAAAELVALLTAERPGSAVLVPMDGFHMRHARLVEMGLAADKGAPHTFEAQAFVDFLGRLKTAREALSGPSYSRRIEDVVDDAFVVEPDTKLLVVEGNYLLLAAPPWRDIRGLLDLAVFIDAPRDLVRHRLLARHAAEGLFTAERNLRHVETVDLPNHDLVQRDKSRADLVIALA